MKKTIPPEMVRLIDNALAGIIDQWYLSVSDHYVTLEKRAENNHIQTPEELKRFHDETGHRIKFNKGDLDFTYGLAIIYGQDECQVEVSVNNKVPDFNYDQLIRRLTTHYDAARNKPIEGYKKLTKMHNCDVFELPDDLQSSMKVERREGKADIVRLPFEVQGQYLEELMSDATVFMELIHQYCVAPLRRIYAEVYRMTKRR